MNLVRVRPFRDVQDIQSNMNQLFADTVSRFFGDSERSLNQTWTPPVDIYETQGDLVVQCELPGFERDDIDIAFDNGRLTITAERKFEQNGNRTYHTTERWYGKFFRTFLLPTSVNPDGIVASLKNGVLTLTLPKKEEARTRHIEVSAQ